MKGFESYFDTEITIPVRIHYTAHKGYPQTYYEPGEPPNAEIHNIEFIKKIRYKTDSGHKAVRFNYFPLSQDIQDAIENDSDYDYLEDECLESAAGEEEARYIDAMEAKMEARREEGY